MSRANVGRGAMSLNTNVLTHGSVGTAVPTRGS
jgi:hypothetical protein